MNILKFCNSKIKLQQKQIARYKLSSLRLNTRQIQSWSRNKVFWELLTNKKNQILQRFSKVADENFEKNPKNFPVNPMLNLSI